MTQGSRADGMFCIVSRSKRRLRAGLARVDERAGAGDRHGFLHGRQFQRAVDLRAEADGHADVLHARVVRNPASSNVTE